MVPVFKGKGAVLECKQPHRYQTDETYNQAMGKNYRRLREITEIAENQFNSDQANQLSNISLH